MNIDLKRKKDSYEDLHKKLMTLDDERKTANSELCRVKEILKSKDEEIHQLKKEKEENYQRFKKVAER